MASTNADVIRRAFRFLGVVASGKSPQGNDASDAMEHLQSLFLQMPGLLMNGVWHEVAVVGAYTALEGDRCTVTTGGSVTLPTTITTCDDAVLDNTTTTDTRPPRDLARVQILGSVAGNPGLWVYSATKAAWNRVDNLSIEDDFPLGEEDVMGIAAQLAVNMMDEYGDQTQVSARTVALAQQSARSIRARLKKAEPEDHDRPGTWRHERHFDYF